MNLFVDVPDASELPAQDGQIFVMEGLSQLSSCFSYFCEEIYLIINKYDAIEQEYSQFDQITEEQV